MSTNETQSVMVYSLGKRLDCKGSYPHYTNPQGEEYTPAEQREIQAQILAERYLERDVVYCQSYLVEEMMRSGADGFSLEEVVNLYPDPEEWTVEQCREYLEDRGVDVDDLPDPDPFRGWPTVEKVATALQRFQDHAQIYLDEYGDDSFRVELGVNEDGSWGPTAPDSAHEPSQVYDYEAQWEGDPRTLSTRELATFLLEECKSLRGDDVDEDDTLEAWQDAVRDNSEAAEIYEWWLVTDWLADKLEEAGEPVLRAANCAWWGRCCTGQNIILDDTLQSIAKQFLD